jgi:hypothetical protein
MLRSRAIAVFSVSRYNFSSFQGLLELLVPQPLTGAVRTRQGASNIPGRSNNSRRWATALPLLNGFVTKAPGPA